MLFHPSEEADARHHAGIAGSVSSGIPPSSEEDSSPNAPMQGGSPARTGGLQACFCFVPIVVSGRQRARKTVGCPETSRASRTEDFADRGIRRHPRSGAWPQLQPLVEPQVSHFSQVPLRTMVKFWHSVHMLPV